MATQNYRRVAGTRQHVVDEIHQAMADLRVEDARERHAEVRQLQEDNATLQQELWNARRELRRLRWQVGLPMTGAITRVRGENL